jgi:hypothetical protein
MAAISKWEYRINGLVASLGSPASQSEIYSGFLNAYALFVSFKALMRDTESRLSSSSQFL